MQSAHHLSELWKNKKGSFLWNSVVCEKTKTVYRQKKFQRGAEERYDPNDNDHDVNHWNVHIGAMIERLTYGQVVIKG